MLYIGGDDDVEDVYIAINANQPIALKILIQFFEGCPMDFQNVAFVGGMLGEKAEEE